jgi:hypothetical protein
LNIAIAPSSTPTKYKPRRQSNPTKIAQGRISRTGIGVAEVPEAIAEYDMS